MAHCLPSICRHNIFSKASANRLKTVIGSIVESDQTYCVPNHSIFDNQFLVPDIISTAAYPKLNLELLSLDHETLYFEVFGFSPAITGLIKLLSKDVIIIMEINGSFTRSFSVSRGKRQGCAHSGLPYIISFEPLLIMLRAHTGIIAAQGIPEAPTGSITAYADDVTVMRRAMCRCCHRF